MRVLKSIIFVGCMFVTSICYSNINEFTYGCTDDICLPNEHDEELKQETDEFIKKIVVINDESSTEVKCDLSTSDVTKVTPIYAVRTFTLIGCGGGNHFTQFLMLAKFDHQLGWQIVDVQIIGMDLTFVVDYLEVHQNAIVLYGMTFSNSDPHCCPSVPHTESYTITKFDKLKQQ